MDNNGGKTKRLESWDEKKREKKLRSSLTGSPAKGFKELPIINTKIPSIRQVWRQAVYDDA